MKRIRIAWRVGSFALLAMLVVSAGCTLFESNVDVDFEASETEGAKPFLVEFTPLVDEEVVSYLWNFGDGETSTDSSPVHVYRVAGTYDVSLTVEAADGSIGTTTHEALIEVVVISQKLQVTFLYWLNTGNGTISTGDRAGGSSSTIVNYIYNGGDLAAAGGYVFWAADDSVYRANYDGSDKRTIATNQAGLFSVTVDNELDKVYWTCLPSSPFEDSAHKGRVKRANLDGSGVTVVKEYASYSVPFAWWIRSDASGEKVFWQQADYGIVVPMSTEPKASCNGTFQWTWTHEFVAHQIKGSLCDMRTMAVDVGGGPAHYVYWTAGDSIKRCKVDGSDTTTVLSGLNYPKGIAVDLIEGKMYWSDSAGIHRANVDGTAQELIYSGTRADVLVIRQ